MTFRWRLLLLVFWLPLLFLSSPAPAAASGYQNFKVAIYVPEFVVEQMKDPSYLQTSWDTISSQVKVDKVYLETYRSGRTADDALLDQLKKFFTDRHVEVAGGIGLTVLESNNFQAFCYTDPKDRDIVKSLAEKTARHFNEIILDDFFFNNTKDDSDIAAKGNKSWAQFRLDLMDDVSRNLIVNPAKAVNPNVKVIIKFPNWYEHFQGNGYDLANEPRIFDGIWTGNETREADNSQQHLQQYESYEITRYYDNIAPGKNGGGWVDTGGLLYADRYAEQLWDTMLAKAPTMMLFSWNQIVRPATPGDRQSWSAMHTSFDYQRLVNDYQKANPGQQPAYAGVAGYALAQIDPIVGKVGNPIGIASYKPYDSWGEDFLQNYFGMLGVPINMVPTFPTGAKEVLLTQEAAYDPQLVPEIKSMLQAGGNVIMTSGLAHVLEDKGLGDLIELHSSRQATVDKYSAGYGQVEEGKSGVLIPEIDYYTNDALPMLEGYANGNSFPILLSDHYSKGVLYILTIPENFNDLYAYPQGVVSAIKNVLMGDFPVRLDGPSKVGLFAYDNKTFVVESFLDHPTVVTVSITGDVAKITNMETGDTISGQASTPRRGYGGRLISTGPERMNFQLTLLPHSYAAFSEAQ
jgi:hypothetical protein